MRMKVLREGQLIGTLPIDDYMLARDIGSFVTMEPSDPLAATLSDSVSCKQLNMPIARRGTGGGEWESVLVANAYNMDLVRRIGGFVEADPAEVARYNRGAK